MELKEKGAGWILFRVEERTSGPQHPHTAQRHDLSPNKQYRSNRLERGIRQDLQLRLVSQRVQVPVVPSACHCDLDLRSRRGGEGEKGRGGTYRLSRNKLREKMVAART